MHAGARGKGLVDRILAFSRSGIGERVPIRAQSVVEETLELLAASLPADVHLERRLDALDTAVVGDATQFHQVVMNLCTNALQAMKRRGVLTVVLEQVAVAECRSLSHGTLCDGSYVHLSVSDTGDGIPPAVLERMFDPFFTTKRVGDGTGLGLALVHGIVADFGGAIDVANAVRHGHRLRDLVTGRWPHAKARGRARERAAARQRRDRNDRGRRASARCACGGDAC